MISPAETAWWWMIRYQQDSSIKAYRCNVFNADCWRGVGRRQCHQRGIDEWIIPTRRYSPNFTVRAPSKVPLPKGDLDPHLKRCSLANRSLHRNRHLDRFSRFCTAQHTDTQATQRATSEQQAASMHRVQLIQPNNAYKIKIHIVLHIQCLALYLQ